MPWLEKGDSSVWIQLEQNNVDTAREKSSQLFKELNNEHLVNDYEDVITDLCQKWGRSALQSLPMFLHPGPGHGLIQESAFHLLSQQLRSRAEMPFPPHSFA